jgi:hypothetical protein
VTAVLQRLAALRRVREQRALEALTVQAGLVRCAEQQAEEAARSVGDQIRQARARERELIGALAGRAVSQSAIMRAQTELDSAALETARLRAVAARAQADLLKQQRDRAEALAKYQRRQRATAKIDIACEEEAARLSRRETALSDAEHEDHRSAVIADGKP